MYADKLYIFTVYVLILIYYCQTAVITTEISELLSEPKKIIKFKNSNNLIYHGSNKKNSTLFLSLDNGASWENISELENEYITGVIQDSIDDNKLYAIARSAIYQSSDSGNDWTSTKYNFTITKNSLKFNLENQKTLVIGKECNFTCTDNLYISNNKELNFTKALSNVHKCVFFNYPNKNTIFCIQRNLNGNTLLRSIDDFGTFDKVFLSGNPTDIIVDEFKLIIPTVGETRNDLWISTDGNIFTKTAYSVTEENNINQKFKFLKSNKNIIGVVISSRKIEGNNDNNNNDNDNNNDDGNDDGNDDNDDDNDDNGNDGDNDDDGNDSDNHDDNNNDNNNNDNKDDKIDTEKKKPRKSKNNVETFYTISFDGTYLIKKLSVENSLNKKSKGIKCRTYSQNIVICNMDEDGLRVSKISLNNGVHFNNIDVVEYGKTFPVLIDLYSVNISETNDVYSGKIICSGRITDKKGKFTLMTVNGGLKWEIINDTKSTGIDSNHGSLTLLVSKHRKYFNNNSTNTFDISYSFNNGKVWEDIPISGIDNLRFKKIFYLSNKPNKDQQFMIIATEKSKNFIYSIKINININNENECLENDIEIVNISTSDGGFICMNGLKRKILRRKLDKTCIIKMGRNYISSKFLSSPSESCECETNDYYCDVGFVYDELESIKNNIISCKSINPLIYQPKECNTIYSAPSGVKKIPGNMCIDKLDNSEKMIERECVKVNPEKFNDTNLQLWGSNKPTSSFYIFEREIHKFLYFRNSDIILLVTVKGDTYISTNGGTKWERIFDDYTIFGMILHDVDDKRAYFIFSNSEIWMTDDCLNEYLSNGKKTGKHFFKINTPDNQSYNKLGISIIDFHPTEPDYLVFTGERCEDRNECYTQAYFTHNNGNDWEFLDKNVGKCLFALDVEFKIDVPIDAVYCLVYSDSSLTSSMTLVLYESNKGNIKKTVIQENVVNYFVVSKYLVTAVEEHDSVKLRISLDGRTFNDAKFPPDVDITNNSFTVLESTTGRLFLNVNKEDSRYKFSSSGTLYISNSDGTYYNMVLKRTNVSFGGIVDFEKVQGVEGIVLVNEVSTKNGKPRTVISFDDGATWNSIPRPYDLDNKKVPCTKDDCRLNLHSHSSIENSVSVGYLYSNPSATGILLGVGNVGPYLSDISNADTYMSIDAGLTWKLVKKGVYSWEFIDQGSIIVLIQDDVPTNILYYSTNFGKDWNEYQFLNSEKIYLRTLTSDLNSKSMYAFILGYKQGKVGEVIATSVNFENVLKNQCSKDDFEEWKISGNERKICLLGHQTTYQRKKADSECHVGNYERKVVRENCPCSEIDYECDFSYWRDPYGKCILDGVDPKEPKDCKPGEVFNGSSGYRKIAASTCTGSFKYDDPVKRICGEENGGGNDIVKKEYIIDTIEDWFYFEESETIMYLNKYYELFISRNEGLEWERVEKDKKFSSIIKSPQHKNLAIFLTIDTRVGYYTIDKGKNFYSFELPTIANPLKIPVFSINSDNPGWWLFVGAEDCKFESFFIEDDCHSVLYLTKNYGKSWNKLETYVRHCEWAKTDKFSKPSNSGIFCQIYSEKKGSMAEPMGGNVLTLQYSTDFFKHSKEILKHSLAFAIFDKYMMIAQVTPEMRDQAKLFISTDGELFEEAEFPLNFKVPDTGFTILESSTGKIFMDIFTRQVLGSEHGYLFMSSANGTRFSPSLENTNRNSYGYVDFEKMIGIPGIAIANVVANPDSYGHSKLVQTKISFNDGATWNFIKPPTEDCYGKKFECDPEKEEGCYLHFHSYTERRDPRNYFSTETAVGMMVGIGNVGHSLLKYKDSDTFLTRDAGKTWVEIHKNAHLYEFGDYGGILLLVNDEVPTNFLEFSVDQGKTFKKYQFVEQKDRKVRVKDILTVPDATSLKFILIGTIHDNSNESGSEIMVYLDFSPIKTKKCVIDPSNPEKSDFELWLPSITEDGCLLGEKIEFYRRKEGNDCYMGEKFKDLEFKTTSCSCTTFDYECDFNFVRVNGTCELIQGAVRPISPCINGKSYESTGYRLIPSSKCIDGVRLDIEGAKSHRCSTSGSSWGVGKKIFIIVIPIIAIAAFFFYNKSQSWREGEIRLPTEETLNPRFDFSMIVALFVSLANKIVEGTATLYDSVRNILIRRRDYTPLNNSNNENNVFIGN
jgi:hypothetical protein